MTRHQHHPPVYHPPPGTKEKLYVIKIGGNIIDDETRLFSFLKEFAAINEKKILIHGGGTVASRMALQLGIPQQMIDGRRITDADTLKIVTMVYAGLINKTMVAQLQSYGCNAIGLCGADGNAILAHKRENPVTDYGFAGDIDSINVGLFNHLLDQELTIVIAPITHNNNGQLLNTNADTIAQEIAKSLGERHDVNLIFGFEKSGVLQDYNDERTVIRILDPESYKVLKEQQVIFAGMIPKLDNAFAALNSGVKTVIIGKAEHLRQLIAGDAGTTISKTNSL